MFLAISMPIESSLLFWIKKLEGLSPENKNDIVLHRPLLVLTLLTCVSVESFVHDVGVDPETVGDGEPETAQLVLKLWRQGADDDGDIMGHREGWATGQLSSLHTPLDTLKQRYLQIALTGLFKMLTILMK